MSAPETREGFGDALASALNRYSMENGSNTPDFILAEYLADCLAAFDKAVVRRSEWYGRMDEPGKLAATPPAPEVAEAVQDEIEDLREWVRYRRAGTPREISRAECRVTLATMEYLLATAALRATRREP